MQKVDLSDVVRSMDRKISQEVEGKGDVAQILSAQLFSMVKASKLCPKRTEVTEPIHRYFNFLHTCHFLGKLSYSLWLGNIAGTWNLNVFDKMKGGILFVPKHE